MAKDRSRHDAVRRTRAARTRWRDLFAPSLLVLFALQGIAVQGHSHVHSGASGATVVLGKTVAPKTDEDGKGGAPRIPDSPTCSLCQSLSAGNAPLALAILLLPPTTAVGFAPAYNREPVLAVSAVSYSWTSRGPPSSAPLHL